MPFKSKAQMRYLFAKHPKVAQDWADKYGIPDDLKERAAEKRMPRKKKRKG